MRLEDLKVKYEYLENFDRDYIITETCVVYSLKRGLNNIKEISQWGDGQVKLYRNGNVMSPKAETLYKKHFNPVEQPVICDYDFLDEMRQDWRAGRLGNDPEVKEWIDKIHEQIGSDASKRRWEERQEELANSPIKQLDLRRDFYEVEKSYKSSCEADDEVCFE